MKYPEPVTHTVIIERPNGRHDTFTSHSAEDAEYVAGRFRAAGWDAKVNPVELSPVAEALRAVAA